MQAIRLYDAAREPANWSDIIRSDQYAVFTKHVETGASFDGDGRAFRSVAEATCLLCDDLEEARRFCVERIARQPHLRFEVFDGEGRRNPPLLVLVGPRYERKLPANEWAMTNRRRIAIALLAGSLPLFWMDFWKAEGTLIWPTFIGIQMAVVAARLLHLNSCAQQAETKRQARLLRHLKPAS